MKQLAFVLLLCVMMSGCTRQWFVTVQQSPDRSTDLCFSRSDGCHGGGVEFASLQISRVDPTGRPSQVVWSLQWRSNTPSHYILKHVIYGHTPPGWVQVHAPVPLATNVYYSIAGEFFFKRSQAGEFHVYPRQQFFSQVITNQR
jgi:hypothetical protein